MTIIASCHHAREDYCS